MASVYHFQCEGREVLAAPRFKLLRWRKLSALVFAALSLVSLTRGAAYAGPPSTTIDTSTAATQDQGTGKGTSTILTTIKGWSPSQRKSWAAAGGESPPSRSGGGKSEPSNCYYRASTNRLSLQHYGKTVADGFVLIHMCGGQLELTGDGKPQTREVFREDGSSFVGYADPNPAIPAPVPPQPQDFLEDAKSQLHLPAPQINVGPNAEAAVVNLPLSFWVGGPTEYRASAGLAGGVGVVVTAKLKAVTWNFGEPADQSSPTGAAATLTCEGPGTPASATAGGATPSDALGCSHKFRWKSTADRTGGAGAWTIGASAVWDVTWQSTGVNPAVGGQVNGVNPTTNTQALQVLEYRTHLVNDPNSKPGG